MQKKKNKKNNEGVIYTHIYKQTLNNDLPVTTLQIIAFKKYNFLIRYTYILNASNKL